MRKSMGISYVTQSYTSQVVLFEKRQLIKAIWADKKWAGFWQISMYMYNQLSVPQQIVSVQSTWDIYYFTLSMPLSNFIALIRTSYFLFFSLDGKFPFPISNLIKNTVHRVWLNKKQRKILYLTNLTSFQRLGQKSFKRIRWFLVEMMPPKSPFEIN